MNSDPIHLIVTTAKENLKQRKRTIIPPELLEHRISNYVR